MGRLHLQQGLINDFDTRSILHFESFATRQLREIFWNDYIVLYNKNLKNIVKWLKDIVSFVIFLLPYLVNTQDLEDWGDRDYIHWLNLARPRNQ